MISTITPYYEELRLAIDIVNTASEITEWFRRFGFQSYQKEDGSPVTVADYATQIYIINRITEKFPNDQIIAEEDDISLISDITKSSINSCYEALNIGDKINIENALIKDYKHSKRQWTVDPIDGTKGYQKGLFYAIGIGFMINSNPKICSIAVPNYSKLVKAIFIAEKDQGSKFSIDNSEFKPIKVSEQSILKEAKMCQSLHYNKPWVIDFANHVEITNFVQIDSMAKFCKVADGTADFYIKPMNKSRSYAWDFLPGTLLVKEAGGSITDLRGNAIKFKNNKCIVSAPGLIASNSLIHNDIIANIK